MPGKVSWLDSCSQESTIHVTIDDNVTLCGYSFVENFKNNRWIPYRVNKKRKICKGCLKVAKKEQIDFKSWSNAIPLRDFTDIPIRCK